MRRCIPFQKKMKLFLQLFQKIQIKNANQYWPALHGAIMAIFGLNLDRAVWFLLLL